jgi:hypothetical protein
VDAIFEHVSEREHEEDIVEWLEARVGSRHALNRLKRESQNEAKMRRSSLQQWLSLSTIIDTLTPIALRTSGLLSPRRRNASRIEVVRNQVDLHRLPTCTLTSARAPCRRCLRLSAARNTTSASSRATSEARPTAPTAELVREMMAAIGNPTFGILDNHDTARMLPALEWSGVRMLMNEAEAICRGSDRLWLAGVDDPSGIGLIMTANAAH